MTILKYIFLQNGAQARAKSRRVFNINFLKVFKSYGMLKERFCDVLKIMGIKNVFGFFYYFYKVLHVITLTQKIHIQISLSLAANFKKMSYHM